jgi:D-sedoheptulose 7-phosphate isomerase
MNEIPFAKPSGCAVPQIRSVKQYFHGYQKVLDHLPYAAIEEAMEAIFRSYEQDQNIFLFGNGGSAALASHVACDLGKGTVADSDGSKRFRVLSLTDNVPLMTAWANDTCYDMVFAEQLRNFLAPRDVAVAISGSGNSPNVLRALEAARDGGAINIGLTGFQGGNMKQLCDICIIVPSENMQVIEDLHLSVTHAIFSVIRQRVSDHVQIRSRAVSQVSG